MLTIDVYSDVICPWCFIGKRRLEKGLGGPARHGPLAPVRAQPGHAARGHRAAGLPGQEVRELGAVAGTRRPGGRAGRGEGIAFDFDRMARTPNTFDAHRLIWLAGERGVQDAVVEALFRAYFTDGRDLSDRATLAAVAVEGGLDAKEVNELLAGDRGGRRSARWEQKGAAARHLRRAVLRHQRRGRPVRCPAAGDVPGGHRAGGPGAEPVEACDLDPATREKVC